MKKPYLIATLFCTGFAALSTHVVFAHSATMMPSYQKEQARNAERRGDWFAAISFYRQDIASDFRDAVAHSGLGYAYLRTGRPDRAAEEFKTALRIHPHLPSAENGLEMTFATQADRDAYLQEVQTQLKAEPNNAELMTTLAEQYMDRNQTDSARRQAQAALKIEPNLGHAHCVMGRIELAQGDTEAARADLEAAVKRDRNDDDAWAALGDMAMTDKDPKAALVCYRHAVDASPEHAEWHQKLGGAFAALGNASQAAREQAIADELAAPPAETDTTTKPTDLILR